MYLYRQLSALLTRNQVDSIVEAPPGPKNVLTVSLRTLVLEEGKHCQDEAAIAAGSSKTLQQPADYLNSRALHVALRTTQTVKVTISSPVTGTNVFVVKAAEDHAGELVFSGRITSIVVAAPSGGSEALVEWCMFEIPDLTDADSYRGGVLATGLVS